MKHAERGHEALTGGSRDETEIAERVVVVDFDDVENHDDRPEKLARLMGRDVGREAECDGRADDEDCDGAGC